MKRIILPLILIAFAIGSYFTYTQKETNTIKVAEVAHSVFYTPQYVAAALGYFEEQELNVEFILTSGADSVAAAVLSGDVQIGFAGSETTIYLEKSDDYLVNIAGLTKKDGSFIVAREPIESFDLEDLKNKTIIGGRLGGMPQMTLEKILTENNINTTTDLTIDTSIDFASMAGAFIAGTGDFVTLFEPTALQLEKEGHGYVVASLGELSNTVPYTTYQVKISYLEQNTETLQKFTTAIQKGLDYTHNNDAQTLAKLIQPYFTDISEEELTIIIDRYKNIDAWFTNTTITEQDFDYVQEIMINANELKTKVDYNKVVKNIINE